MDFANYHFHTHYYIWYLCYLVFNSRYINVEINKYNWVAHVTLIDLTWVRYTGGEMKLRKMWRNVNSNTVFENLFEYNWWRLQLKLIVRIKNQNGLSWVIFCPIIPVNIKCLENLIARFKQKNNCKVQLFAISYHLLSL